jgi:hypothetical protein
MCWVGGAQTTATCAWPPRTSLLISNRKMLMAMPMLTRRRRRAGAELYNRSLQI